MDILFALLTLLAGISIVMLPLSTGFFPNLGLTPLKLGHRRTTRVVQVLIVWALAITALWFQASAWSWTAVGIAVWFTVVAAKFYPQHIFVDLTRPRHAPDGLSDAAPVLATEVAGEAIAYPLEVLVPHHLINDVVGGKPILASWCAACHSGLVYDPQVDNRHLTFEVFGVWRRNMVMRDHQTGSIWQHATGEALDGPLKGKQLDVLFSQEMTWGELRRTHPRACYAVEPEKHTGLISIAMLMRVLHAITPNAQINGLGRADRRLDAHEMVVGLVLNGEAKAYPLPVVRAAQPIFDRVGGEQIRLEYHASGDRVAVYNQQGKALPYERQWWLGWSEFHPRSAVYEGNHASREKRP